MELSAELALALLAQLPEGVLLLNLDGDRPTVLYASGDEGAVVGPLPLAELLGGEHAESDVDSLLDRLNRGESAVLEISRGVGRSSLDLLPLTGGPGQPRRYIGLERRKGAPDEPAVRGALPVIVRDDRLTGLAHRDWFWEIYRRDYAIARREQRPLTVLIADIDALGSYNDTFGRPAGDGLIRQVARTLAAGLRRSGDIIAHDGAGRFLCVTHGQTADQSRRHAEELARRVRELHLHHPRSGVARFVTLSLGVAHWDGRAQVGATLTPESLYATALAALAESRHHGRNRATLHAVAAVPAAG